MSYGTVNTFILTKKQCRQRAIALPGRRITFLQPNQTMQRLFRPVSFLGFLVLPLTACAEARAKSASPPSSFQNGKSSRWANCLPAGIKLTDVVERTGDGSSHAITVEQKLDSLKATCNGQKKLVDQQGRQIVFYPLIGCWGHPPPDYQERLQEQRQEIAKLKQTHTVIEMTCNPSGVQIP